MLSREERNIAQEFKRLEKFIEGKIAGRKTIRRWLIKTVGNKCFNEACSVSNAWLGSSITLVVDHIDGNAANNLPSNLRLLCPNCNSQTSTFCGRNIGSGRGARGLSLS